MSIVGVVMRVTLLTAVRHDKWFWLLMLKRSYLVATIIAPPESNVLKCEVSARHRPSEDFVQENPLCAADKLSQNSKITPACLKRMLVITGFAPQTIASQQSCVPLIKTQPTVFIAFRLGKCSK
jgi:hypothetical protein